MRPSPWAKSYGSSIDFLSCVGCDFTTASGSRQLNSIAGSNTNWLIWPCTTLHSKRIVICSSRLLQVSLSRGLELSVVAFHRIYMMTHGTFCVLAAPPSKKQSLWSMTMHQVGELLVASNNYWHNEVSETPVLVGHPVLERLQLYDNTEHMTQTLSPSYDCIKLPRESFAHFLGWHRWLQTWWIWCPVEGNRPGIMRFWIC